MAYPDDVALPQITADDAIARVSNGAILIDVREQDEWDAGHAPQARLIPMSGLQERLAEVPADQKVLIVCHSGARSVRATDYLLREGYDAVNVIGGLVAWNAAGGEIESENPGTPRV